MMNYKKVSLTLVICLAINSIADSIEKQMIDNEIVPNIIDVAPTELIEVVF